MAKGLIDELLGEIFDDSWTGKYGELLLKSELDMGRLTGKKGRILRNIYVPTDDGRTTEIDVLLITQKGIVVFESKNYSGWIFGNEADSQWTMSLPNNEKRRFYNPIRQNRGHIKWLTKCVGDIPMFSVIAFSDRCELKKITVTSQNVWVINRNQTNRVVREIWKESEDILTEEQIEDLFGRLKGYTKVSEEIKEDHIKDIQETKEALICPICGGKLVLRTAKQGINAGNQFYGCCNFPRCRYTQNYPG
jgi:hypothetical protein